MNDSTAEAEPREPERIDGRFIWYRGMLFFKPDEGTMHGNPLAMPNLGSNHYLGLATGLMYCMPPPPEILAGAPEEIRDGYEMLVGIPIDNITLPVGVEFIEHLVRVAAITRRPWLAP